MNRAERRAAGTRKRYAMCNMAYGELYSTLFLENQLKSLLDATNLPAVRDEYLLEYALFTDEESLPMIARHPNFLALGQIAEINIIKMSWPADADRMGARYSLLAQMLQFAVKHALDTDAAALSVWVADLVFAKHAVPRILRPINHGHGAVFNVPIRGTADSAMPLLQKISGAPTDLELFEIAYANLHPLWTHAHWAAPQFTRMPYSMLWNSYSGLLAHSFSITPIVFKPIEAMLAVKSGIDTDLPGMCENPYWATDWTNAPVAGIEPLQNGHYPNFTNHPVDPDLIHTWSKEGTAPEQAQFLTQPLYYPSRKTFASDALTAEAQTHMERLQAVCRER